MSIHGLPLSQVNAALLEELVTNTVAESRFLDYKERLPGASDPEKKEFLADVTSFANTAGGDLIYGVRERRKGAATGQPEAVVGLTGVNIDQEVLRLDAVLRTGMEPRIPGLALHPVLRDPKPACLVIRIPRSPHGIHMVTFKGSSRFYGRGAAGRFELDWGQIRGGFLQAEGAHERVRRFREERVLRLLAGETPIPVGAGPKVILHALPLNSLDVWPVFLTLNETQIANVMPPIGGSSSSWRFNLDGFVVHTTRDHDLSRQTYVQCFRDGGIEAMSGGILERDPQRGGFYGLRVELSVIKALEQYQQLWKLLGMAGPMMFGLTLAGAKGWKILGAGGLVVFDRDEVLDRDVMLIPDLVVHDPTTTAPALLQPLFDLMWNSGGWPRSPSYSGPGVLRKS